MFKVTGSLLVQILKICLNTQFHKKTLNKRKKKKKNPFFKKIPSRKHKKTDGPNERVPAQTRP